MSAKNRVAFPRRCRLETFRATKASKGGFFVRVSRTVNLRRQYNTRHNVTIVRFNDDDRADWSRLAVGVVVADIMHRI